MRRVEVPYDSPIEYSFVAVPTEDRVGLALGLLPSEMKKIRHLVRFNGREYQSTNDWRVWQDMEDLEPVLLDFDGARPPIS